MVSSGRLRPCPVSACAKTDPLHSLTVVVPFDGPPNQGFAEPRASARGVRLEFTQTLTREAGAILSAWLEVFVSGHRRGREYLHRKPLLIVCRQEPESQLMRFVERIQIPGVLARLEMQVRSSGTSGRSHQADHVAARYLDAGLDPLLDLR